MKCNLFSDKSKVLIHLNAKTYIYFIIATPRQLTATEAARVQPEREDAAAHDVFTPLLVIDDSTLDKPFAKHIELVLRHWSGKHHAMDIISAAVRSYISNPLYSLVLTTTE